MWSFFRRQKNINLDYAAATPVRPEVLKVINRYWSDSFGNPSSIHRLGAEAKVALENAREKVARTLRVRATDVTFTSGGTESNNLALRGTVSSMFRAGVSAEDIEIISTAAEHPSIIRSLEMLKLKGVKVTLAPLGEDGRVKIDEFKKLLSSKTRLVSFSYVNSETGVVEDIGRLVRAVRAYEKENGLTILFHTDACQAPRWLPCNLDSLAVDMMSLDAGKCAGPKGVGVLVHRHRVNISPIIAGGSQENGLRPGTEPLALIVGGVEALVLAQAECTKVSEKTASVRNYFISELENNFEVNLNGSREHRVANNINVSIAGIDTEFAVVALSAAGILASTKSACSGAGSGLSAVVLAMTNDRNRASSTIRFTLSPETTKRDIRFVIKVLKEHLDNSKLPQG